MSLYVIPIHVAFSSIMCFFYIWKKEQGKTIKKILFFILLYSQLVTYDNNHIIHVQLFFFIFITLKNFTEDSSQMLDQMQIFVRNGFLLQNNSAKLIHQHYHLHCDLYLSDSKTCKGHFRFKKIKVFIKMVVVIFRLNNYPNKEEL